jgi:Ca2+-binding EF-hand superfamily protein
MEKKVEKKAQDIMEVGIYQSYFNAIDTDGDGKVSQNEYMKQAAKNAAKKFTGMDVNKDGFISSEELKKTMPKKRKKVKEKTKKQHKGKEQ